MRNNYTNVPLEVYVKKEKEKKADVKQLKTNALKKLSCKEAMNYLFMNSSSK